MNHFLFDLSKSEMQMLSSSIAFVLKEPSIGRSFHSRLGVDKEDAERILQALTFLIENHELAEQLVYSSLNEICHGIRFKSGWPDELAHTRNDFERLFLKLKGG